VWAGRRERRQWVSGRLRVGVVGLGMGAWHAQGYQEDGRAEVVALCDVDRSRLEETACKCGVSEVFTDAEGCCGR